MCECTQTEFSTRRGHQRCQKYFSPRDYIYESFWISSQFILVCASNVINNHVWGNVITFDNEKIEPPFQCPPVQGSPNPPWTWSNLPCLFRLVRFSVILISACESYAFHQENIQYTDVIRNPYQKNPIASIMVTLAGKSFISNQAHDFFHDWSQFKSQNKSLIKVNL